MTAPSLLVFFDTVYLVALAAWAGGVMFFSFGVAPIIFRVLGPESAAKFVRALFPRYYTWGAVCGAIALPAVVCGALAFEELRGPRVLVQAMLVLAATLIMLYCGNSLTPAINAARDAGPVGKARFDQLHKRSVRLNGVVLLIGLGLLYAFAARRAPTTSGIVERKPGELTADQERMRRDAEEIEKLKAAILKKVGGEEGLKTLLQSPRKPAAPPR